jgi:secreted PhoX family phosphatase
LSCEEHPFGSVWECDPLGAAPAEVRPALGRFTHEAVAIDQAAGRLYLSEDTPQGRLYRFTPVTPARAGRFTLSAGVLEVAEVVGGIEGAVRWHAVPDPHATAVPTALQVPTSTAFAGGEGIAWHRGLVYFCTKLDNRVWLYDTARESLRILYDDDRHDEPVLTGVDGLAITAGGQVLVAEDEGDMQIVALRADGGVDPIVQVVGHRDSEIAGPAFDPSGTRLYFSSQRGPGGSVDQGITYEVSGPFAAG